MDPDAYPGDALVDFLLEEGECIVAELRGRANDLRDRAWESHSFVTWADHVDTAANKLEELL